MRATTQRCAVLLLSLHLFLSIHNVEAVSTSSTKGCFKEFCEQDLEGGKFNVRYMVNAPAGTETAGSVCDECTVSFEVLFQGEAWVGIGFSKEGQMIGSNAVIGLPDDSSVLMYNLEAKTIEGVRPVTNTSNKEILTNATIKATDGKTAMNFTTKVAAENAFLIWAYGSGNTLSQHAGRGSLKFDLSGKPAAKFVLPAPQAWVAHGVMAFLAWGVFAPFAVLSSLLRQLLPNGPVWFQLHMSFNLIAFGLFIILFFLAISITHWEGERHLVNNHEKMGLAMFLLAIGQVISGIFRPHLRTRKRRRNEATIRKCWSVCHRFMGLTLLACGFWQMSSGMALYSVFYPASSDKVHKLTIAYWVWIGVMSSAIIIGGVFFRWRSRSPRINQDFFSSGGKQTDPLL